MKKLATALTSLTIAMSAQVFANSLEISLEDAALDLEKLNAIDKSQFESNYKKTAIVISDEKREMAQFVATHSDSITKLLKNKISWEKQSIELNEILESSALSYKEKAKLSQFDQTLRSAKGIDTYTDSIVQLRLAKESMLPGLKANSQDVLFAYEPAGDEETWTHIEAFDAEGNVHLLDVSEAPKRPVIVVDINGRKSLTAGIRLMQEKLSSFDKKGARLMSESSAPTDEAETGLSTTVLDRISLKDDKEPWVSGDADVYSIVVGIDSERKEPNLDVLDMPYLDTSARDYYPSQTVVIWDRYRYQAADMILMEQDDNTNYQDLVVNLFDIASQVITMVGEPQAGTITQMTSKLISAMPNHWFSNDDDYVDVLYTIQKGKEYRGRMGASANASVDLRPLVIPRN
ncbi:DUF3103 family protein [Algicola sagamiensis]|uniref:DUF3103 family protein n=1 Tax=Algicola sagamiensis TaxID=163869 RepID=UPI0003715675|nr:DUF3103 family protein [Algicola sagamiensis]